jgi:protein SCO1/2
VTRAPLAAAVAALAAASLAAPTSAAGQFWRQKDAGPGGPPSDVVPDALKDVGIEERLGEQVPLDAELVDWTGKKVKLGDLLGRGRPVVLSLVYYDCPMLCGLIMSGEARAIREMGLTLGKDYDAVTISFDPAERPALAAERRRGYLQSIGLSDLTATGWSFLVGPEASTRRIADAVGFSYRKDPRSNQWAHLAAIFVLTPDGKVSRYLYGIEFPPKELRLSLVEAAGGRVGTTFDRFILTCYRYDPASRRYEPYALGIVRAGGALVLVALTALIGGLVWRERKARGPA